MGQQIGENIGWIRLRKQVLSERIFLKQDKRFEVDILDMKVRRLKLIQLKLNTVRAPL